MPAATGAVLDTGRHQIVLIPGNSGNVQPVGIDYAVADLPACRALLAQANVPFEGTPTRLVVPAEFACNVTLGFEA